MWKLKINKKAFTLVEIILVVFIISLVYYFTISSFKFSSSTKSSTVDLVNIKTYLSKFGNDVTLVCINNGKKCLVMDNNNNILEEVSNLFKTKPTVYEYNKDLNIIYYKDMELKHLDRYEVCFKYNINKYNKSKDMIVEVDNKFYIFNSIHNQPILVQNTSDIYDYFYKLEQEVKDAF